jgi:hypothetical protein
MVPLVSMFLVCSRLAKSQMDSEVIEVARFLGNVSEPRAIGNFIPARALKIAAGVITGHSRDGERLAAVPTNWQA